MKKTKNFLMENAPLVAITSFSLGIIATIGATNLTAYSLSNFPGASTTQHDIVRRFQEHQVHKAALTSNANNRHNSTAKVSQSLLNNRSYRNAQIRRQERVNAQKPNTNTRQGIYEHCKNILGLSKTRLTHCIGEWEKSNTIYQLTQSHQNNE